MRVPLHTLAHRENVPVELTRWHWPRNASLRRSASSARCCPSISVRSGIQKRLTPHGLRRTLNTLALEVAPSEAVRKVLGHADAAMTERYLAPSMDAKRAVLGKVVTLVRGGDVGIIGGDRGAR